MTLRCPACNSYWTEYRKKSGVTICRRCDHKFGGEKREEPPKIEQPTPKWKGIPAARRTIGRGYTWFVESR